MPSIHHPPVPYPHNIDYLRNLLLGFSTYIVLCGVKAHQIMSQASEKSKTTRAHWATSEVVQMLEYLNSQKSRMGAGNMFPAEVIHEVELNLKDSKKNYSTITSKYNHLRRVYMAIDKWRRGPGHGIWSTTHGADIRTLEQEAAWKMWLCENSAESTLISRYRNTAFDYYEQLRVLLGEDNDNPFDEGIDQVLDDLEQDVSLISTNSTTLDSIFDQPPPPVHGRQTPLSVDELYDLGVGVTSLNPAIQLAATQDALSVYHHSSPPTTACHVSSSGSAPVISDRLPRPRSSRTSLISRISKGKTRASTPAPTSFSSYNRPSRPGSSMANAAAVTGMTSAINRATDLMHTITQVGPTTAPPPIPTNFIPPEAYLRIAMRYLEEEARLPSIVRSEMALALVTDERLCEAFASMRNADFRCDVALRWYHRNFVLTQPTSSSSYNSSHVPISPPFSQVLDATIPSSSSSSSGQAPAAGGASLFDDDMMSMYTDVPYMDNSSLQ